MADPIIIPIVITGLDQLKEIGPTIQASLSQAFVAPTEAAEHFSDALSHVGDSAQAAEAARGGGGTVEFRGGEEAKEFGQSIETANRGMEVLTRSTEAFARILTTGRLNVAVGAVNQIGESVKGVAERFGEAGERVGFMATAVTAAIASIAGAAYGLRELGARAAEDVNRFHELAGVAGLTSNQFAALQVNAAQSGVGLETLQRLVRLTSIRIQNEWGSLVHSVRTSGDELVKNQLDVNEAMRKEDDAEGTARLAPFAQVQATENLREARVQQQLAPHGVARAEAGLEEAQLTIPQADLTADEAHTNLAEAQLRFRRFFDAHNAPGPGTEGQIEWQREQQRLQRAELASKQAEIKDREAKETEGGIPEAEESLRRANFQAGIAAPHAVDEASEALIKSKHAEADASDEVTRAAIGLHEALLKQQEFPQQNAPALAAAIGAGGRGVNWAEVSAPDIFRALTLRSVNPATGVPDIQNFLPNVSQFYNLPAIPQTTKAALGGEITGTRGAELPQVIEFLTKAAANNQNVFQQTDRSRDLARVADQFKEPSENFRTAIANADVDIERSVISLGGTLINTAANVDTAVSGSIGKVAEAATSAATALGSFKAWLDRITSSAPPTQATTPRPVGGLAAGGLITGPGGPTGDEVTIHASDGEYVVKADTVRAHGIDRLDAFNDGKIGLAAGYADGGLVRQAVATGAVTEAQAQVMSDEDLQAVIRSASPQRPAFSLPLFSEDEPQPARGVGLPSTSTALLRGPHFGEATQPAGLVSLGGPRHYEAEGPSTTPISLSGSTGMRELRERLGIAATPSSVTPPSRPTSAPTASPSGEAAGLKPFSQGISPTAVRSAHVGDLEPGGEGVILEGQARPSTAAEVASAAAHTGLDATTLQNARTVAEQGFPEARGATRGGDGSFHIIDDGTVFRNPEDHGGLSEDIQIAGPDGLRRTIGGGVRDPRRAAAAERDAQARREAGIQPLSINATFPFPAEGDSSTPQRESPAYASAIRSQREADASKPREPGGEHWSSQNYVHDGSFTFDFADRAPAQHGAETSFAALPSSSASPRRQERQHREPEVPEQTNFAFGGEAHPVSRETGEASYLKPSMQEHLPGASDLSADSGGGTFAAAYDDGGVVRAITSYEAGKADHLKPSMREHLPGASDLSADSSGQAFAAAYDVGGEVGRRPQGSVTGSLDPTVIGPLAASPPSQVSTASFDLGQAFLNGGIIRFASGGNIDGEPIRIFPGGGPISGPGGPTEDKIPAWVSNGEFIIKASRVAELGVDNMHALNEGRIGFAGGDIARFAEGGPVDLSFINNLGGSIDAPHIDPSVIDRGDKGRSSERQGAYHILDIRTDSMVVRGLPVASDTLDSLEKSSIGSKLTRAAVMPTWRT